ncbi:hypothetical protein AJ79_03962 [Helicocarpus griseus UAMH5409]|uniref:Uncharacterized protein n=1 Tax=Helicocarpus griseus UAMH5409 TaxID=1447875 RepID=A0A2B7XVK6_9EURO|nr:hypothetical protein AJ79_03962 [Helicocarpus griseus UAMH5409]
MTMMMTIRMRLVRMMWMRLVRMMRMRTRMTHSESGKRRMMMMTRMKPVRMMKMKQAKMIRMRPVNLRLTMMRTTCEKKVVEEVLSNACTVCLIPITERQGNV